MFDKNFQNHELIRDRKFIFSYRYICVKCQSECYYIPEDRIKGINHFIRLYNKYYYNKGVANANENDITCEEILIKRIIE